MADAIWFLGADEERWPGRGQPHPLLPIALQRESGMPHASPAADWEIAQLVTKRLLASADEVVFSYSRQAAEWEARPSRLVKEMLGPPERGDARTEEIREPLTEIFEDRSLIPFPLTVLKGGARALTTQSLCPFQAFATARLAAGKWEPAELGLTPKQRGQLLHDVLHKVWAGSAKGGVASLEELRAVVDLPEFVTPIIRAVMRESFASGSLAQRSRFGTRHFPARYLELEADRLVSLVSEWLQYERTRQPFTVAETEVKKEISVAGIGMQVQLDRVDVLNADSQPRGTQLIVDYKSGDVSSSSWNGDRPDDVQLPLYATFAVEQAPGGLVFGVVRPGKCKFDGRVRDARATLLAALTGGSGLVKNPLDDKQLMEWRQRIEQLGEAFVAGRADVDPKVPGKTCERCHLQAVCRIYENQPLAAALSGDEDDAGDEENADAAGGRDA
jgi:probable DNA repair protein